MNEIYFEWKNQDYIVGMDAYDTNLIRLPDGKFIQVNRWLESMPPIPQELEEVILITDDAFAVARLAHRN